MHDEMMTNPEMGMNGNGANAETVASEPTQHVYYDVGGDLFSKPNALGDILEAEGIPPALIFCNSPSDADLVDVLLKKRGISSIKLIGHVPPQKTQRSLKQLRTGELQAIVATDVASADLDNDTADFVVNYAMPTDPELYIHRSCHGAPGRKPKKVVSLVGPLDIAHFHYVKKFADFEFTKAELPTRERMTELRIEQLAKEASIGGVAGDERIQSFVQAVLRSKEREAVIALLLRNTIDVLPSLKAASSSSDGRQGRDEDRRGDDRRSDDRRGDDRRGDDRRGGFDRRDRRGGRDGGRGGRNRRNDGGGDGYESQAAFIQRGSIEEPPREEFGDGEMSEEESTGRREGRGRGERTDRGEDRRRERRQDLPPADRECRLYLGHGANHGFTEAKFVDILKKSTEMGPETMKRFRVREHYSFADFPQDVADQVVEKLGAADLDGGKLFVRKAIVLGSPRDMNGGGRDNDRFQSDNSDRGDDNSDDFDNRSPDRGQDQQSAEIAANDSGTGPTYLDEEDMP